MPDDALIREKLAKIKALFAGATVDLPLSAVPELVRRLGDG